MAKKYIDADRLKQTIADNVYPVQDAFNSLDYGMFWTGGIEKAIDEAPAADVVKVCRCGECENWKADFPYNTCGLFGGRWNENMFCSYGRRKRRKNG